MAPTEDERRLFGQRLRRLRREQSISAARLGSLLRARGFQASGASVSAWERGEYSPQTRELAAALAEMLDDGDLLRLLGYGEHAPDTDERLTRLEDAVDQLVVAVAAMTGRDPDSLRGAQ